MMNILILLFLSWTTVAMSGPTNQNVCDINNNFNKDFLKARFGLSPDKSVIVSAYSLLAPLSQLLLASGDKTQTEKELLSVLGVAKKDDIRESVPKALTSISKAEGITLNEASKIYIQKGLAWKESFIQGTIELFGSEIEEADLKSVAATAAINAWVEKKTNYKIKELLNPAEALNSFVALINAVYFNAAWAKPFNSLQTNIHDFHMSKSHSDSLPFMNQIDMFMYSESEELNSKLIELPYVKSEAKFLAVVPNDIEGLKDLMQKLSPTSLGNAKNKLSRKLVSLYLPKFKIETETDLVKTLKAIGIHAIFESGELTNLLENDRVGVKKGVQKAYISVSENGTEAAAANAFMVPTSNVILPPVAALEVDRPFYFEVIVGNITIFSGVFQNN